MSKSDRRDFLFAIGAGGALLSGFPNALDVSSSPVSAVVKPISGSWFEFQHHATVEGVDWNPQCADFSCAQWDAKVKEMAGVGMEYLVLMATALYYRAFFPTNIFPPWRLACADPMEAVLAAADKYGIRLFIGGGFYGDWEDSKIVSDRVAARKRLQAIEQLAQLYSHHKSFYGWYWPNEAFIDRYYSGEFIDYVNKCSRLARRLTPNAKILIAPYGTRVAVTDDKYVRQLESLDVDVVAYQDEVGVQKSTPDETPKFYEGLRKAHDMAQRAAIWADVEIFQFEGKVYKSALLPAPFSRVLKQLTAVSPWVDKVLIYQYQGMMNKPGSAALCGSPSSARLYTDYADWLKGHR
ncbi:MAG: DUF4434 domain-containing protein [Acidobacteria bacterium]|nr:MAG: DUF4434 domain-containing protein [Acidobacteriota bacterium]